MPSRNADIHPVPLAQARDAACLTLAEMAQEAGLSIQTCWRVEHAKTHPLPRTKRALSRAVGVRLPAHILWPRRRPAVQTAQTAEHVRPVGGD